MRISVEDGIVVCSIEDKNRKFLAETSGCFNGFYHNKLRLAMFVSENTSEIERIREEFGTLRRLLYLVKHYGGENTVLEDGNLRTEKAVEVDAAVYERLEDLSAVIAVDDSKKSLEREAKKRRELWESRCRDGCDGCEYLRRDNDDRLCAVTKELLEEKNVSKNIGSVHYMFNYVAFPSEKCPFKVE